MELLSIFTGDNAWNIATALLMMVVYVVPVQYWDCLKQRKQSIQQQQQQLSCPSTPPPITKHLRRVSIVSPLPHPATDTTEVSEETEASDSVDDHIEVKEMFRTPPVSKPSKSKPVKIIGKPIRLAGIPESPCPALNSALKLKRKLMRHDAACHGSVSGGSSTGSGKHHRRSHTSCSLSKTPKQQALRRCRSDTAPPASLKRDVFLLDRLSEEQTAQ